MYEKENTSETILSVQFKIFALKCIAKLKVNIRDSLHTEMLFDFAKKTQSLVSCKGLT